MKQENLFDHLERAFPPVPPMVHDRMEKSLKEIKTMKKSQYPAALAFALALVFMVSAVAMAATQSGVLYFIFGENAPDEAQRAMVQTVEVAHEGNGVTAVLSDAVFDGRFLSLGLNFEGAQDVYALVDSLTVDGEEAYLTLDTLSRTWLTGEEASRGLTALVENDSLDKEMRVCLSVSLLVPKNGVEQVELFNYDTEEMWRQLDRIVAEGKRRSAPGRHTRWRSRVQRWAKAFTPACPRRRIWAVRTCIHSMQICACWTALRWNAP